MELSIGEMYRSSDDNPFAKPDIVEITDIRQGKSGTVYVQYKHFIFGIQTYAFIAGSCSETEFRSKYPVAYEQQNEPTDTGLLAG